MKPLVFGGEGILGRSITEYYQAGNRDVASLSHSQLDIRNRVDVIHAIEKFRPTVIYNAAAMTALDVCEREKAVSDQINAEAPSQIAEVCWKQGIPFVHFSTDYVFDGLKNGPYSEKDQTSPLSVYSESKVKGEKWVLENNPKALVVRVAWVFRRGGKTFLCRLRDLLFEKEILQVANDRRGNCTYGLDAAERVHRLVEKEAAGLVHFTNEGELSWFDFAQELLSTAKQMGLNPICREITPISSQSLKLLARRPSYSGLDKSLYCQLTGEKSRHWRETLPDFLREKI